MRLANNLLAGLANSVVSALVGLAVVPLYLKYLGIEAYGLIGFFATTQAMLQILDMGLAPTMNREVARHSASGDLREAGRLLHTLAIVYWIMSGIIALFIVALAPLIAGHWLQSKQLSPQTISHAVMLMGLVVACRWPIGLYQGALMGAQRLTVASGVSITMVTLGSLGAVAVLAFLSPTIEAFFIWQAGVGLVYAATMRWAAWRVIGRLKVIRFDVDALKSIWRFSAGMSGISLSGLVFTQLDKVILSKMLELEEFGHYMLATLIVSGLYVLITPMFNVVYPRFSALVVADDTEKLIELYRLGTRMLATVLFPIAMFLVVFAEDFVLIWTGNQSIASSIALVISILTIGSALNGVMYFPYALQLAYGMTWIPITINIVLMCFIVPLIIFLAQTYGAVGGAMAWLISEIVYVILGPWLTHRYLLKGLASKWVFQDIGIPLAVSIFVGLFGRYTIYESEYPAYFKLFFGGGLAIFTSALLLLISRQLRIVIWDYVRWKKYVVRI